MTMIIYPILLTINAVWYGVGLYISKIQSKYLIRDLYVYKRAQTRAHSMEGAIPEGIPFGSLLT